MTKTNEPPAHWFQRIDEDPDKVFYASPRFVEHIDKALYLIDRADAAWDDSHDLVPVGV